MENKQRIPLRHCKNSTELKCCVKNEYKTDLFQTNDTFPLFVTSISERLVGVGIKIGDYIISINGRNVSRASAKSLRDIIKGSNEITMILNRPLTLTNLKTDTKQKQSFFSKYFLNNKQADFKKIFSCIKPSLSRTRASKLSHENCNYDNEQTRISNDYGYCSIPRDNLNSNHLISVSATSISSSNTSISSASSLSSCYISYEQNSPNIRSILTSIQDLMLSFLNNLETATELYVRPSLLLQILNQQQSIQLYQNIEKLIPVTKFMLNVFSTFELNLEKAPNFSSLSIVFDSFKTYLNGLPNAVKLLGALCADLKFVRFLESLEDADSFKIFDLILMPLNFICDIVQGLKTLEVYFNNEEAAHKLSDLTTDLYHYCVETQANLEEKFLREIESEERALQLSRLDNYDEKFLTFKIYNL